MQAHRRHLLRGTGKEPSRRTRPKDFKFKGSQGLAKVDGGNRGGSTEALSSSGEMGFYPPREREKESGEERRGTALGAGQREAACSETSGEKKDRKAFLQTKKNAITPADDEERRGGENNNENATESHRNQKAHFWTARE